MKTISESTFDAGRRQFGKGLLGAGATLAAPALLAQAKPAELKFACIVPLTGQASSFGIRNRDGATVAVEHFNSRELVIGDKTYSVRLDVSDMANDARQAITLMRQAASDPSYASILCLTSSVAFVGGVPVAAQLKMPVIGAGSDAPVKQWNPYMYRVNPVSELATPLMIKKVVAKEKIKRLAVIYDQMQDAQVGDAELVKKTAADGGYEIVEFQAFRTGDQDFSPQLATIRAVKPDGIFLGAGVAEGVRILAQMRGVGINAPVMTGFGTFLETAYWDGTSGGTKGGYTWITHDLMAPQGELKAFFEAYNKRFKLEATSFSAYGYDAVAVAVEALRRAGAVDREKMREVLASLDMTTPLGTRIKFQNPPSGNNLLPTMIVTRITGRGTYEVI